MIYLDNAATTKVDEKVLSEIIRAMNGLYANPSASYSFSEECRNEIAQARKRCAELVGCEPSEIYFTSGGTEADNWAIRIGSEHGRHIITTKIEHHAILNPCKQLEKNGYEVTYLNVDRNGYVNLNELENAIREDTGLVSIMYTNNEIGTVQKIGNIANICRRHNVLFHTDAVQAIGHEKINMQKCGIDMLSCSGHKFHAPKGIGFLAIRNGIKFSPMILGGNQENGKRAGTENVSGIVGIGCAANIAVNSHLYNKHLYSFIHNFFINMLQQEIPNVVFNNPYLGQSNIINITIPNVRSEEVLEYLNLHNICASSGSACNSLSNEPSHVLKAIGLTDDEANCSIRLSTSKYTSSIDIIDCVHYLKEIALR